MAADDRQMTEAEYKQFLKLVEELEAEQHEYYIAELLAAQDLKIKDLNLHIKILEGLLSEKRDQLQELSKTLEQLELEIARLK